MARTGSGSARRSVPGGFVEWQAGFNHETSFAGSIAPPEHWALADCVAVVSQEHNTTHSIGGHALANTSPLQAARVAGAHNRLNLCRRAILEKDFATFAEITELESNLMHGVMMTSKPNLFYWRPATLAVIRAVQGWRTEGLEVCFTIDAGPNVHVLCPQESSKIVAQRLINIPGVEKILTALPGGPARLI